MHMESDKPTPEETDHEAPTITRLGTLSELTLGGPAGTDDMLGGGNGDFGSAM